MAHHRRPREKHDMSHDRPRIALLGFAIECNRFAPVTTRRDFEERIYLAGDAIMAAARDASGRVQAEVYGFVQAMDAAGLWEPVPILLATAEPNGPVEHGFFAAMLD